MKIVFDTSVLIAAFYKPAYGPSFSREVYDYVMEHETAYVSQEILNEFKKNCVLKLKLGSYDTARLISIVLEKAQILKLKDKQTLLPKNIPLRDLTDRHVLELAFAVKADVILSWDKDLLDLEHAGNIKIMTPRTFWDSLPRLG